MPMPSSGAIDEVAAALADPLRELGRRYGHEAIVFALHKLGADHAQRATPPVDEVNFLAVARIAYRGSGHARHRVLEGG